MPEDHPHPPTPSLRCMVLSICSAKTTSQFLQFHKRLQEVEERKDADSPQAQFSTTAEVPTSAHGEVARNQDGPCSVAAQLLVLPKIHLLEGAGPGKCPSCRSQGWRCRSVTRFHQEERSKPSGGAHVAQEDRTQLRTKYPQIMRICTHLPLLPSVPIWTGALIQLLLKPTKKKGIIYCELTTENPTVVPGRLKMPEGLPGSRQGVCSCDPQAWGLGTQTSPMLLLQGPDWQGEDPQGPEASRVSEAPAASVVSPELQAVLCGLLCLIHE
ncbi:hypothetical protein CB1_001907013 [Camelus ferus]|nr:hypothetical protein CB1_001907013 [Camelus ferus]